MSSLPAPRSHSRSPLCTGTFGGVHGCWTWCRMAVFTVTVTVTEQPPHEPPRAEHEQLRPPSERCSPLPLRSDTLRRLPAAYTPSNSVRAYPVRKAHALLHRRALTRLLRRSQPRLAAARASPASISYLAKPRFRGFRQIAFSYRSPDFGASLGQVRDMWSVRPGG